MDQDTVNRHAFMYQLAKEAADELKRLLAAAPLAPTTRMRKERELRHLEKSMRFNATQLVDAQLYHSLVPVLPSNPLPVEPPAAPAPAAQPPKFSIMRGAGKSAAPTAPPAAAPPNTLEVLAAATRRGPGRPAKPQKTEEEKAAEFAELKRAVDKKNLADIEFRRRERARLGPAFYGPVDPEQQARNVHKRHKSPAD